MGVGDRTYYKCGRPADADILAGSSRYEPMDMCRHVLCEIVLKFSHGLDQRTGVPTHLEARCNQSGAAHGIDSPVVAYFPDTRIRRDRNVSPQRKATTVRIYVLEARRLTCASYSGKFSICLHLDQEHLEYNKNIPRLNRCCIIIEYTNYSIAMPSFDLKCSVY